MQRNFFLNYHLRSFTLQNNDLPRMIDRSLEMGSSRIAEFPVVEMTLTCGT